MENSFFEYRDNTVVGSDSDSEIIDNSLVVENYYTPRKNPGIKNQTVFVAESEESSTDGKGVLSLASFKKKSVCIYRLLHIMLFVILLLDFLSLVS